MWEEKKFKKAYRSVFSLIRPVSSSSEGSSTIEYNVIVMNHSWYGMLVLFVISGYGGVSCLQVLGALQSWLSANLHCTNHTRDLVDMVPTYVSQEL